MTDVSPAAPGGSDIALALARARARALALALALAPRPRPPPRLRLRLRLRVRSRSSPTPSLRYHRERVRLLLASLVLASLPSVASADAGLGRALHAPSLRGGDAELTITSDVTGDEASVDGRPCQTPCRLRLPIGPHRLTLRSGGSTEFTLYAGRTYARGHGRNDAEIALGIGLMMAAAAIFVSLAATSEEVCWDFDSGGCQPELGPILIGVSVMSMAVGVGLLFDSAGSVEVARFAPR